MRELNGRTIIDGESFAEVASAFIAEEGLGDTQVESHLVASILSNTITHLKLTVIALGLGCLFGLPLGILVFRTQVLARATVYLAGLLQTIPSIALLALMIPLFGIGEVPAIIALFLYSILPILRNTITALVTIDPLLKRVAEGNWFNQAAAVAPCVVTDGVTHNPGGYQDRRDYQYWYSDAGCLHWRGRAG